MLLAILGLYMKENYKNVVFGTLEIQICRKDVDSDD